MNSTSICECVSQAQSSATMISTIVIAAIVAINQSIPLFTFLRNKFSTSTENLSNADAITESYLHPSSAPSSATIIPMVENIADTVVDTAAIIAKIIEGLQAIVPMKN